MGQKMYFPNKEIAWRFANLISEARGFIILDYGYDAGGYYIEYEEVRK